MTPNDVLHSPQQPLKSYYQNVIHHNDEGAPGRLILTPECLRFHPKRGCVIMMPWNSIVQHTVLNDEVRTTKELPSIRILDFQNDAETFTLQSWDELERLENDMEERLGQGQGQGQGEVQVQGQGQPKTTYSKVKCQGQVGRLVLTQDAIMYHPPDGPVLMMLWKSVSNHRISSPSSSHNRHILRVEDCDQNKVTFEFSTRNDLEIIHQDMETRLLSFCNIDK